MLNQFVGGSHLKFVEPECCSNGLLLIGLSFFFSGFEGKVISSPCIPFPIILSFHSSNESIPEPRLGLRFGG